MLDASAVVRTLGGERFVCDLVGQEAEVYTWAGKITLGRVRVEEGPIQPTFEVELDDGSLLCVSRDQFFVLRDGRSEPVDFLAADQSLMPLYLKQQDGYGYYREPGDFHKGGLTVSDSRRWRKVDRMVMEHVLQRRLQPGERVVHLDGDKLNVHPDNLTVEFREPTTQTRNHPLAKLHKEARKLMGPDNHKVTSVTAGNCFAKGSLVYVVEERSLIRPTPIEVVAAGGAGQEILAWDFKKNRIVPTPAINPRLTKRHAGVVMLYLSNGRLLRVTPDHKFWVQRRNGNDHKAWAEAKDLELGDVFLGLRQGYDLENPSMLTAWTGGNTTLAAPVQVDVRETPHVYDITTKHENLIVDGVVAHNSASLFSLKGLTAANLAINGVFVHVDHKE